MSNAPVIGVLALQGAVAEHRRAIEKAGAQTRLVRRSQELENLDGLIVPGGESTAMARLAAGEGLMPAIRQRHDQGMAVFGTCAGLIMLAEDVEDVAALDGFDRIGGLNVAVRRNAYGTQTNSFTSDVDVTGLDLPFRAVFIRAPTIEEVHGERVEVLATTQGQPTAVRQGRLMGTCFHPELTDDHRLHGMFVELSSSM